MSQSLEGATNIGGTQVEIRATAAPGEVQRNTGALFRCDYLELYEQAVAKDREDAAPKPADKSLN